MVPLGHCHPAVVEAIARQASTLNTHTRYVHETVLDYAEALLATYAPGPGHVMFTCTGSEANDLALRIAQAHRRRRLIVTRHAYHGVTLSIAQASPSLGRYVTLGPAVRTVAAPDSYRQAPGETGPALARAVREAIADLARHGLRPAALMVDTIFSSDGVQAGPAGFLREAVDAIHEAGGLFIADEVQAGMGRTGETLWGYMRHGVAPDLITMGKPLGNGHPWPAWRPGRKLEAFGRNSRYFNTFGGNPVSAAAGLAVLRTVQQEGLMRNAERVGAICASACKDWPRVMISSATCAARACSSAWNWCATAPRAAGHRAGGARGQRLARPAGADQQRRRACQHLKIRPPLPFSTADADRLVAALDETLAAL